MRLGENRFRAGGFLDFRRLGIFLYGLSFSHPMPLGIGYFLYRFGDVFSHRVWDTGYLIYCFFHMIPFVTRHMGVHAGRA